MNKRAVIINLSAVSELSDHRSMNVNQQVALAILAALGAVAFLSLIGAWLIIGAAWDEYGASRASRGESQVRPSGWKLVWRACSRRCPSCGRGRMFHSYFGMNTACPACGAVFWKNEGEWIGPVVIDYAVAVTGVLASWAALMFFGFSEFAQIAIPATIAVVLCVGAYPGREASGRSFCSSPMR
jgi:uncharacterized protein (DUF983 family)